MAELMSFLTPLLVELLSCLVLLSDQIWVFMKKSDVQLNFYMNHSFSLLFPSSSFFFSFSSSPPPSCSSPQPDPGGLAGSDESAGGRPAGRHWVPDQRYAHAVHHTRELPHPGRHSRQLWPCELWRPEAGQGGGPYRWVWFRVARRWRCVVRSVFVKTYIVDITFLFTVRMKFQLLWSAFLNESVFIIYIIAIWCAVAWLLVSTHCKL